MVPLLEGTKISGLLSPTKIGIPAITEPPAAKPPLKLLAPLEVFYWCAARCSTADYSANDEFHDPFHDGGGKHLGNDPAPQRFDIPLTLRDRHP